MATVKRFEDLDAWKLSRELCGKLGELIDNSAFKKNFRLIGQIEGSSGSIMDNIAEGFERGSQLKFVNSLSYSKGEAGELRSQLYRCLDNHYIDDKLFNELLSEADLLTRRIAAFITYRNSSKFRGQKFKNRS